MHWLAPQTPSFLRHVDSPDSNEGSASTPDSPEIATALVSTVKARNVAIPVDSPLFAKLSPVRLLKAKRVRALDEQAHLSTTTKAIEMFSKTYSADKFLSQKLVFAFLILSIVFMLSNGPTSTQTPIQPPIVTSITPTPVFDFDLDSDFSERHVRLHADSLEQIQIRTFSILQNIPPTQVFKLSSAAENSANTLIKETRQFLPQIHNAHSQLTGLILTIIKNALRFIEEQVGLIGHFGAVRAFAGVLGKGVSLFKSKAAGAAL